MKSFRETKAQVWNECGSYLFNHVSSNVEHLCIDRISSVQVWDKARTQISVQISNQIYNFK